MPTIYGQTQAQSSKFTKFNTGIQYKTWIWILVVGRSNFSSNNYFFNCSQPVLQDEAQTRQIIVRAELKQNNFSFREIFW